MPPELATDGEVSPRSDLCRQQWAMLNEKVTRRPLFPGDDKNTIISQHTSGIVMQPSHF